MIQDRRPGAGRGRQVDSDYLSHVAAPAYAGATEVLK